MQYLTFQHLLKGFYVNQVTYYLLQLFYTALLNKNFIKSNNIPFKVLNWWKMKGFFILMFQFFHFSYSGAAFLYNCIFVYLHFFIIAIVQHMRPFIYIYFHPQMPQNSLNLYSVVQSTFHYFSLINLFSRTLQATLSSQNLLFGVAGEVQLEPVPQLVLSCGSFSRCVGWENSFHHENGFLTIDSVSNNTSELLGCCVITAGASWLLKYSVGSWFAPPCLVSSSVPLESFIRVKERACLSCHLAITYSVQ